MSERRILQFEKKITQEDLEQLIYLRRLLDEAHEQWLDKREEVRDALESGAEIEPGVHWASLVADKKKGRARLMVR